MQGVAPGQHGRRAVEEVRDLEGQRAADHVLLAQRADDGIRRLALVHRDDDLRPLGPERVRLELVPEHEGEHEDEQRAADGRQDATPAAHHGPAGAARRPSALRPAVASASASACVRPGGVSSAGGLRRPRARRLRPGSSAFGPAVARPVEGSSGPLMRCPARPAAAPWPRRCRRPGAPPCRCARPPAASVRPPRW